MNFTLKNPTFEVKPRTQKAAYKPQAQTHSKKPYTKPQAVTILEELAFVAQQKKYPNTPSRYLVKKYYRDDTANGLTQCIIDYIKLYGGHAERINTMGIPVETPTGVKWRTGNTEKGSADISATIRGRSVKIEIKIGRDRQSDAQKQYQSEIEAAGGLYYIAKNFTAFVDWYAEHWGAHEANQRTGDLFSGNNNKKI